MANEATNMKAESELIMTYDYVSLDPLSLLFIVSALPKVRLNCPYSEAIVRDFGTLLLLSS